MTPLICISSMATRQLLATLCTQWAASGGQPVALESVGGVDAARRIDAGDTCDVVVLASDALDKLLVTGRIGTPEAMAQSQVAIAAAPGTNFQIETLAQLCASLANARSIGFSTGPSGKALLEWFERLGILASLRDRLVQAPPGTPVGNLIAQGVVEIGFQQCSELIHCKGIDLLGPLPPGSEITTVFSAAVCRTARETVAAAQFIAFLRSSAAFDAIRQEGMAPAGLL
ncbi:molybdate transport system substrate-binding protein [Acidovorax soli]|uniref:Molybdate transport system substrate-binding protein n=2 Tax=Acidovorax soli TaxID=592050 RepID=A0A1H4FC66_9BURK|nr:molybdate transport system substrate-binding protein [Acidovorax soli]